MTLFKVFQEILEERPHVSEISGKPLEYYLRNSNYFFSCFAHIIPKSAIGCPIIRDKQLKEQFLKLNKDNIMLVLPIEHVLLDQSSESQRKRYEEENYCSFDIFYTKKEKLMQELKNKLNAV